ncbi:hypothetical protein DVH24_014635 [Malus domestica]|uniref:Uncharacterized protein n=1 Tax=Malus domestica TaxID=3750 RepID=A0A498KIR5_MALDO|nr:hypothetical protein DVH24_014635 [Malus domestica]
MNFLLRHCKAANIFKLPTVAGARNLGENNIFVAVALALRNALLLAKGRGLENVCVEGKSPYTATPLPLQSSLQSKTSVAADSERFRMAQFSSPQVSHTLSLPRPPGACCKATTMASLSSSGKTAIASLKLSQGLWGSPELNLCPLRIKSKWLMEGPLLQAS